MAKLFAKDGQATLDFPMVLLFLPLWVVKWRQLLTVDTYKARYPPFKCPLIKLLQTVGQSRLVSNLHVSELCIM